MMRRGWSVPARRLWACILVLLLGLGESGNAFGQDVSPDAPSLPAAGNDAPRLTLVDEPAPHAAPQVDRRAIKAVASYLASAGDPAGEQLDKAGYHHPGISDDVWRSFTPYSKMETAYLSAERGSLGGGERMLAILSRSLAQEYESAGQDARLKNYVDRPLDDGTIQFATLDGTDARDKTSTELKPEVREAIGTLAHYCDGGSFGPRTILSEYLEIPPDRTSEILRTSRTHEEILERGFQSLDEASRDANMKRLVESLDSEYESARSERAFDPWRPQTETLVRGSPPERHRRYALADRIELPQRIDRFEDFRVREFHPDPFVPSDLGESFGRTDAEPRNSERSSREFHGGSFEHRSGEPTWRGHAGGHLSRASGRVAGILILLNFCLENPEFVPPVVGVIIVAVLLGAFAGGEKASPSAKKPENEPDHRVDPETWTTG